MNKKTNNTVNKLCDSINIGELEIEFSIFCIENVAKKLEISGEETYDLITKKSDILDGYIIPNYDILHTQSKDYIVNDIIEYMKECGVIN